MYPKIPKLNFAKVMQVQKSLLQESSGRTLVSSEAPRDGAANSGEQPVVTEISAYQVKRGSKNRTTLTGLLAGKQSPKLDDTSVVVHEEERKAAYYQTY